MSADDTADWLRVWSSLIDQWAQAAAAGEEFRWSEVIDCEQAAFVVHGLERCMYSHHLGRCVTEADLHQQGPFTLHVIEAFLDALSAEGKSYGHHAEQVKMTLHEQLANM